MATHVALFHGRPLRIGIKGNTRRYALLQAAAGIADVSRFAWTDTGKLTISQDGDRQVFTGWEVLQVKELR